MTQTRDQYAQHAAAVAREIYGEPNKKLSTKDELRFGNQGSISVDVKTGLFFDHEQSEGGGVLWAIERVTGQTVSGGHAIEWMRSHGFYIEDDAPPSPASKGNSRTDRNGNWLPQRVPDHGSLTATYDYRDAGGDLAYQVCRYDWDDPDNSKGHSKTFVQRKPNPKKANGWDWSTKGMTPLPYRLPELLEDIASGYPIFIVEGEKKVDMLRAEGVPATCNHGGAGKFGEDLVQWFKGSNLILVPDNDQAGKDHAYHVGRKVHEIAASVRVLELPDLPPKGSVDDWFPAGGTVEQLYDLADRAPVFQLGPFTSKFGAVQWLEFDAPGPSYEYLIKGVLTRNEISMLLGESQSGKSFLAIEIAMCVARGVDFFGHKSRKGGVIYQAGESAAGVRRRRFPAYRQHYECARDPLPVVLLERPVDFYNSDEQVEQFIEECRHWATTFNVDLELIVIDTFNRATPGANENDGKDMGTVLARCDAIRRATGAHVMLVHHLNAGGTKARGHTSLFANVENVVTVRKVLDAHDGDNRQIREWTVSKVKEGEDGVSKKFVLPQVQIGIDHDGDPITSCVVQPPQGGAQAAREEFPDGAPVSGFSGVVLRAIYTAMAKTSVLAPQDLGLSRGAQVIDAKAFWGEFRKEAILDEEDEEDSFAREGETPAEAEERQNARIRKKIQRAREDLMRKGLIDRKDGWIWLTGRRAKGFETPPGLGDADPQKRRRKSSSGGADVSPLDLPFDTQENPLPDDMRDFA